MTALIDRLEKRGYVRRKADPEDRRKVMVEATEAARRLADDVYAPLAKAGAAMLEKYSEAELRTVDIVPKDALSLQERAAGQLLARHGKP